MATTGRRLPAPDPGNAGREIASQWLCHSEMDLAREALTRRAAVTSQMSDLQGQQAALQAEQDKLTVASQRLQAQMEAFRTRKETIKAACTAAEAETSIREAVTGISEEMGDVGMAVQPAQDKTEQLQARAGALDELLASGALQDATVPRRDPVSAGCPDRGPRRGRRAGPDESTAPGSGGSPGHRGPRDGTSRSGGTAGTVGHIVSVSAWLAW